MVALWDRRDRARSRSRPVPPVPGIECHHRRGTRVRRSSRFPKPAARAGARRAHRGPVPRVRRGCGAARLHDAPGHGGGPDPCACSPRCAPRTSAARAFDLLSAVVPDGGAGVSDDEREDGARRA
jgi:hypothetical protein